MKKNAMSLTIVVALILALMLVAMPAVGAGDVACDWTGTWDTCWGKMELVQTGIEKWVADVNGTAYLTLPQRTNITYKPEGKITGLVFDNTLEGWWTRYPSNTIQRTRAYTLYDYTGNLVFTISEDCNSFEGEWWYGDRYKDDWGGVWTGSREGPSKQPSKQSVCASFKPRIADVSESKPAEFTIGGTEPQKVRITQPAENFGIVNVYGGKYGGIVYQRIDGKSWGSLTLEPGTYRLSCGGGGAMNLMSATVCIEYPGVEETPSGPGEEVPEVKHPPEPPEVPSGEKVKPSLPPGPIDRIIVYPIDDPGNRGKNPLVMQIGKEKHFAAWGVDAAHPNDEKPVIVDEWKVSDEDIGSIKKDGLFKAGPKEGPVKIRATAEGITGVFRITVSAVPPITFMGCVKLYDEYNKPVFPGGVGVNLDAQCYDTREDLKQGYGATWGGDYDVQTDPKGRFKFVVSADVYRSSFVGWKWTLKDPPTTLPGYKWLHRDIPRSQVDPVFSNEAEYLVPIKPDKPIAIAPKGFECFELWLEYMPTSLFIDGKVTHHRKAVEKAQVRLLYNGKRVKDTRSDKDGEFNLYVDNLSKGRYMLTAQYKPKDPPKDAPWDPNNVITVHSWLYIRKDILVELPLETERKTIDIDMISFAEKIGYTGP